MFVIDEIRINDIKLASITCGEKKEFSVQTISDATGISIAEFVDEGMCVDITFKLKSYGVGVG